MGRATRPRKYRLQRRAERQAATKRRIVEAAVDLHGSVGPSRTSIAAIARRAEVQRNTVYAHFTDEAAIFAACSGLWYERHPPPAPSAFSEIADAGLCLGAVLRATYAYFGRNEAMLANLTRDMEMAAVQQSAALLAERWVELRDVVVTAFRARGARRKRLQAAVDLALSFETRRTLTRRGGLSDDQAADLMVHTVQGMASSPRTPARRH